MHKHSAFVVLSYTLSRHICGQFLPFCFAEPLVLYQAGWGTSVRCHFQILPTMFNWLQAWALTGSLKDIHTVALRPLLCLGCVFRVVFLSEHEALSQPEVQSALELLILAFIFLYSPSSCFLPRWTPLCLLRPSVPLIFFCTLHIYAPTNHY